MSENNTPSIKEVKAIAEWMKLTNDIREISFKMGDVELAMSRNHGTNNQASASTPSAVASTAPAQSAPVPAADPVAAPAPSANQTESAPEANAADAKSDDSLAPGEVFIKAPMVGTFYSAPRPGAEDFVTAGDTVAEDTVLGIVEVMKLMNNLEAKVAGTVSRILVENGQAVEFGEPLMVIQTNA